MLERDRGLVLRVFPLRETSVIACILCRTHGRLRLVGRGVRAPRSRAGASLEPGNEIDFVFTLKPGRDLGNLREASLLRPWVAGLDRLRTRGIDAVVMDLQFSRFLRANADVTAYREALEMAAAAGAAPLFDRYELMKAWADADRVDVERAPRERRTQAVDRLNDCLGRALAIFLLDGMREARR